MGRGGGTLGCQGHQKYWKRTKERRSWKGRGREDGVQEMCGAEVMDHQHAYLQRLGCVVCTVDSREQLSEVLSRRSAAWDLTSSRAALAWDGGAWEHVSPGLSQCLSSVCPLR